MEDEAIEGSGVEDKASFQFFDTEEWDRLISGGGRIGELASRTGTDAELEKIRKRVRRQRAYDNLLSVFSLIGSVVIAGLLVYLFYSYLLNR